MRAVAVGFLASVLFGRGERNVDVDVDKNGERNRSSDNTHDGLARHRRHHGGILAREKKRRRWTLLRN